jgi:hypothetical protein
MSGKLPEFDEAWRESLRINGLVNDWEKYAGALQHFEGLFGPDLAASFTLEVLDRFRSGDESQQIQAVAAWFHWLPEGLVSRASPSTSELASLRDRVNAVLDIPPARSWFGGGSPNPTAREVLTECRDALDQLCRVASATAGWEFAYLKRLAEDFNRSFGIPFGKGPYWKPGAAIYAARLYDFMQKNPVAWRTMEEVPRRLIDYAFHQGGSVIDLAVETADRFAEYAQSAGPIGDLCRNPVRGWEYVYMLECLRGWGEAFGIEFRPSGWFFTTHPSLDELRTEGVVLAAVYRPDEPAGTLVRLKALGIVHNGEVVRPAVLTVSAGPAPPGFAELEELVATADDPAGRHLQERLHGWRDASLNGSLESAAVAIHVEFWDRDRAGLDPSLASAFADRLVDVLREAFGLTPFFPSSFPDHPPGWVEPADGGRMTTGRVREVLRPGLVDRGSELRVPARAVVE